MICTKKLTSSPSLQQLIVRNSVKGMLSVAAASMLYLLPVADTSSLIFTTQVNAAEEEGQRPPPETRQSETLTRRVYTRIEEVIALRDMEDYVAAKAVLDEIYEMHVAGRLNGRETQTMFLFYSNLAQLQDDYEAALGYQREILKIEGLAPEIIESTWTQVGNLSYALEKFEDAIEAYETLTRIALEPDDETYLRLSYAHYQIEEYEEAIPPMLKNFEIRRANNDEIPKNSYGLLRALYLTLEDFEKAYQVVREMVVLYNEPQDWIMLAQLSASLERFSDNAHLYWVADVGGFLDRENQFVSLAQLLSSNDFPYACGEVISKALDEGILKEEISHLKLASTCFRLAREDQKAIPFLRKASELSEDGDNFADLALVYMTTGEFDLAAKAFESAIAKGNVSRPDQMYLNQIRALFELNRFDDSKKAAQNAAKDERSKENAETWMTIIDNRKRIYDLQEEERKLYAEWIR